MYARVAPAPLPPPAPAAEKCGAAARTWPLAPLRDIDQQPASLSCPLLGRHRVRRRLLPALLAPRLIEDPQYEDVIVQDTALQGAPFRVREFLGHRLPFERILRQMTDRPRQFAVAVLELVEIAIDALPLRLALQAQPFVHLVDYRLGHRLGDGRQRIEARGLVHGGCPRTPKNRPTSWPI